MGKKNVSRLAPVIAGGAAGIVNGFFGGGGGMILVPLLVRRCGLSQRQAFATSVAIILPLCILSSVIYYFRGGPDLTTALPYLAGGFVGGWVGGKVFKKCRKRLTQNAFCDIVAR